MAKQCSQCGEVKEEDSFQKVGGRFTHLRGECIDCRRMITKHKASIVNFKNKQKLSEYGCCVCGISRCEVLEVHHLHGSYKRYGRSQTSSANLQDLEKGTAVVLCANDHSLFHSHFGGKNSEFPIQTKESVIEICILERKKGGFNHS